MRRTQSLLAPLLATVVVVLSCTGRKFPGSEILGTFDFTAFVADPTVLRAPDTCPFVEMPIADFAFSGTFSRNPDGETFFTLGDIDRSATFDGQIASSTASAPRLFDACDCADGTVVDETLTVSLLSESQSAAVGGACPPNPLDGGVPPPGGDITGPGSTGTSFDALLACGELFDQVVITGSTCACAACNVLYPTHGVRR